MTVPAGLAQMDKLTSKVPQDRSMCAGNRLHEGLEVVSIVQRFVRHGRSDFDSSARRLRPRAGQLVGNFEVDRSTGDVTGADPNIPLLDRAGQALARQMVLKARQRLLSPTEAQCLARKAAEVLPGCDGQETVIEAKPFGPTYQIDSTSRFEVTCRRPTPTGSVQDWALLAVGFLLERP